MHTMKKLAYTLALVCIAISVMSCVTTTTTLPDGTVIETSAPAPGSVEATAAVATVVASKIHADK